MTLKAGGGRVVGSTGRATTPTGMQSSIKKFLGKEVNTYLTRQQPCLFLDVVSEDLLGTEFMF